MAGTFVIGEKKIRPGTYFRRTTDGSVSTAGAVNGITAAMFAANWGPLNKEFDLDVSMQNELSDYYGNGTAILKEAFKGGATTIRAVRIGSDDGEVSKIILKGTKTVTKVIEVENLDGDVDEVFDGDDDVDDDLDDDGGTTNTETSTTPATNITTETTTETVVFDAVEISAAYVGDRAFTASIRTNLITEQRQLVIYEGTEIFAQVNFTAGNNEASNLVAAMKSNKNFNARLIEDGTLNDITQVNMEGGKNPSVYVMSYDKGSNVLERYKWNCLIADSDDAAVIGILDAFADQSYEMGHLGMVCVGGKSSQAFEDRINFASTFNDEKMVYVLNGWLGNDDKKYEGYLAAARIGGMISSFEANTSITHNVISGAAELIEPLTNGEITKAEQKGCLVLSLNDSDQVQIDSAINTLITPSAEMDEGWKKIRRTKCRFELMDRVNSTVDKLVGRINNDQNGRQTIIAAAQSVINEMVRENKLMFGSYVHEDDGHPAEGDSAWFILDILDIDSAEHIYLTYRFRFGQSFDE